MKYKIGDKVKIREDLKGGCEYDELYFERDMEEYKGKIATITRVDDGRYSIDLDKTSWYWNDDMFENVTPAEEQLNNKISELEKQIAELKEQLKKKDNKMPVGEIWKPEKDTNYYYNHYDGETDYQANDFYACDVQLMGVGNCYSTREKAEFEANREKYTRLFRQYIEQHSEPIDWRNTEQKKYCVNYDHEIDSMYFYTWTSCQPLFQIYASSEQVLGEAIDFVGEDNVKKYILAIGE